MNKPLYDFFTNDHHRVEAILARAIEDIDNIQMEYYEEFRVGLMTHIKMEEKILFLAAQKANDNKPIPLAKQLRLEHGALTALMSIPPYPGMIRVLLHILEQHDIREEEPGGMYDICEKLTQDQTQEILDQLAAVTPVPARPVNPLPMVYEATKRSVARAGYDYDALAQNDV